MEEIDFNAIDNAINVFEENCNGLTKVAFVPAPQAPPPQAGGAPMDPAMAQGGAPPPMDPAMAAQGGGMPPAPMDPAMMQQGGAPPMDPAMMQGGGEPMPPQDPGAQQINPEQLDGALSDLANGVGEVAKTVATQQQQVDNLTQRFMQLEQKIDDDKKAEILANPAPFEGSTKRPIDVKDNAIGADSQFELR